MLDGFSYSEQVQCQLLVGGHAAQDRAVVNKRLAARLTFAYPKVPASWVPFRQTSSSLGLTAAGPRARHRIRT